MTARRVYLDHNATTPILSAARTATIDALDQLGNPSSVHRFGAAGRQLVEAARDQVAKLIRLESGVVVFTSGGTEANNMALCGVDRPVIVSAAEHDSVLAPAKRASYGATVVPTNTDGVIDLQALREALLEKPRSLVSLMLANNETGVCQPIQEAVAIAHEAGALVHCDAVQGPGKLAFNMRDLDVDMLTISAHKFGGPMGVGALIVRESVEWSPRQVGGGQEGYRRAGTQNVPGIAGFGAAAGWLLENDFAREDVQSLRDQLEAACGREGAVILGGGAMRLPNTSCLTMPGVSSETQVMAFDLDGIAVSAGAACSSGKVGPSHVLAAMGVAPELASSAIRVSLGPNTTEHDIARFVDAWSSLHERKTRGTIARLAS